MKMNLQTNAGDVASRVSSIGKQAVFAAAVSLTRAAQDGQRAIKDEMRRAFVGPTAYALNGTFTKGATKDRLESKIWVKDNVGGKGTTADRFLLPQIYGGKRGQKGMERLLQTNGLMPAGWVAVPAAAAQLDGNGNVKRSQVVQIMSQLKLQRGGGYESRATGSARSARTIAKQGVSYFAIAATRRGLQPGIYMKRKFALGTAIKPVFLFVAQANYRARLRFFEVGQEAMQSRFRHHFDIELAKAIATARLGPAR